MLILSWLDGWLYYYFLTARGTSQTLSLGMIGNLVGDNFFLSFFFKMMICDYLI